MLITKIAAKNFKTYKELELDLSVIDEKPIVLIGGINNGGKTTLFDAIYYALYGIVIKDAEHFKRLVNASVPIKDDTKIELTIDFKGKVLSSDYFYKIKRVYALNTQKQPVESVTLNFNGDTFTYGTATPFAERTKSEAEVNKIIKSNLPKELSKYFLFDAMKSGDLLKEDYLSRVIKENIENVMGFNKYIQLGDATVKLKEKYITDSIAIHEEREEYTKLLLKKAETEALINENEEKKKKLLGFSIDNKELYLKAKDGKNLEQEYKEQIQYLDSKLTVLKDKEIEFISSTEKFINDIEIQAFLPKLIDSIHEELELIVSKTNTSDNGEKFTGAQLDFITQQVILYLKENNHINQESELLESEIKKYITNNQTKKENNDSFDYLSDDELATVKTLLNNSSINNYNLLNQSKKSYENEITQLPTLLKDLNQAKSHLTKEDNSIIDEYEKNEEELKDLKAAITNLELANVKTCNDLSRYDISEDEIPNPKLELLKKLEPLFEIISDKLLVSKKQRIEETMLEDLNTTLVAYAGQIERVELSEKLNNLSFKIYHKAGNEIYLEELNAASKQIIVQVLLKALHQFGDYNPPVMIDTVMGYLSEDSRASLLENYFPKLSHQTILFSTDTEIRKDIDLPKIEEFISKKYTLIRDKVSQSTEVTEGYFNN
jgi:DNA sulfur modification protein DndD